MSHALKGAWALPELEDTSTRRIAVLQMSRNTCEFDVPDHVQDVDAWAKRVYGFKVVEVKDRATP